MPCDKESPGLPSDCDRPGEVLGEGLDWRSMYFLKLTSLNFLTTVSTDVPKSSEARLAHQGELACSSPKHWSCFLSDQLNVEERYERDEKGRRERERRGEICR
ncbi:unnamed protein product [Leuciscus chuanchicus]